MFAAFGVGCALVILACAAVVGGVLLLGAYEFGYFGTREVKADGAPPDADIPEEGRLLLASDLRESWQVDDSEYDDEFSWYDDAGRHLRVTDDDDWSWALTAESQLSDVSASIRVRQVSTDLASMGCLLVRGDAGFTEQYSLCISSDGEVITRYSVYAEKLQDWHHLQLGDWSTPPVSITSRDWNSLKIVSHGNTLWFIVNDTYVGQAFHDGPVTGHAGFYVSNDGEHDAEWMFDDLVIRKAEAE